MKLSNRRLVGALAGVFASAAVMTGLAVPASQAADNTINIISLYKTSGGPEANAMKLLISKFEAASGAKVKPSLEAIKARAQETVAE